MRTLRRYAAPQREFSREWPSIRATAIDGCFLASTPFETIHGLLSGIVGAVTLQGEDLRGWTKRALTLLEHRGPDARGIWCDRSGATFGKVYLNISEKRAPHDLILDGECDDLTVVCDGEIYNGPFLRKELERRGHRFRSNSDEAVIVHGFEEWGEGICARLNGIFAFAIWNSRSKSLFLARDHFGIKPLYVTALRNGHTLLFGSELKAIVKEPGVTSAPNWRLVASYLSGDAPAQAEPWETFFDNVYQLPHASFARWSPGTSRTLRYRRYWDVPVPLVEETLRLPSESNERDDAEELGDLLSDAVRLRLRGGERVGALLSGGIDSSALVALAAVFSSDPASLKTFSARYDDSDKDEGQFIASVVEATRTTNIALYPDDQDLAANIERFVWHHDEPIADLTLWSQWEVFRTAAEYGVRAVFDGVGVDGILGGHIQTVHPLYLGDLLRQRHIATMYREIDALRHRRKYDWPLLALRGVRNSLPSWTREHLGALRRAVGGEHSLLGEDLRHLQSALMDQRREVRHEIESRAGRFWADAYLSLWPTQSLFQPIDRSGLAHGVEVRPAFRDARLVEFFFQLPTFSKVGGYTSKRVLRLAMNHRLPRPILEREKLAWPAAHNRWLYGEDAQRLLRKALESPILRRDQPVDRIATEQLVARCTQPSEADDQRDVSLAWRVISLTLWHRNHFE